MGLFFVRNTQLLSGQILKFTGLTSTTLNKTLYTSCVSCGGGENHTQTDLKEKQTTPHTENNTVPEIKTAPQKPQTLQILGQHYKTDSMTNITPRVLSKIGANLHNKEHHPLNLIHQRIKNHFYTNFQNRYGNPQFTMFNNLKPVVTVHQNFDSLLVPEDHVSRSPKDSYYVNSTHLLRAHTSAHQEEIIKMGFDSFLVFGDVYRRDEIDASHYPVFHQCEGVKLFSQHELFSKVKDPRDLTIFEKGKRSVEKQGQHTMETAKLLEHDLKSALLGLTQALFGSGGEYRWVDEVYFPFTHPSWELEIKYQGAWLEVLGCGIIEQRILNNAGAHTKVGWAFGFGLDRLAMKLYDIPDIRLLWSEDPAFINQFKVHPNTDVKFKPFSKFQSCINDISFWIPQDFSSNDFYDLVRSVGGDVIEQVTLVDEFVHRRRGATSHCYRIVYRHMDKIFTQEEVNVIHREIESTAKQELGVEIR